MRTLQKALMALVLISFVAGPAAALSYLSVDWYGSVQTINFTITGTSVTGANIALARGSVDSVNDQLQTPGYRSYSKLYCVDVFNYAKDSPWPIAHEWDVREYTGVDGELGWRTPQGDDDHWRAVGGLAKAAYLANTYSWSWLNTDTYDKQLALNVAIWKAAYGDLFTYSGGLSGDGSVGDQLYYYNLYMQDYSAGRTANQYVWFDNNALDTQDIYQDFLSPVPEPGVLLLLGTGLLSVTGASWWRRRRPSV